MVFNFEKLRIIEMFLILKRNLKDFFLFFIFMEEKKSTPKLNRKRNYLGNVLLFYLDVGVKYFLYSAYV